MERPAGTWLIYPLTIEGSYRQDIERPAPDVCDSMQYWITPGEACDVRTFFIDKDLRILGLDLSSFSGDPIAYLDGVARDIYGGMIKSHHRIDLSAGTTDAQLIEKVSALGLFANAHWTELNFPLWLPENVEYASRGDD
jgi:hypothetical protein